jgi:hypothetical protein
MQPIIFAGKEISAKDLIAQILAANYLRFGFADDGEANIVAQRILDVLDDLGCAVVKLPPPTATAPQPETRNGFGPSEIIKVGDVVRYSPSMSDLMKIISIEGNLIYGDCVMSGTKVKSLRDVMKANESDLTFWEEIAGWRYRTKPREQAAGGS